ncbi:MAG: FmdB family zinc ribbon protein [Jatrophihabitantaceae bacterium]
MPTYQYACTNDECGLRFERVQAFTDEAITTCPDCTDRVRKVYGSVGVVFKGSGFYRNDSRQAAGKGAESSSGGSTESSDSSGSKPASTDKPKPDKAKSDSTSTSSTPAKSSSSETKSSAPVAS